MLQQRKIHVQNMNSTCCRCRAKPPMVFDFCRECLCGKFGCNILAENPSHSCQKHLCVRGDRKLKVGNFDLCESCKCLEPDCSELAVRNKLCEKHLQISCSCGKGIKFADSNICPKCCCQTVGCYNEKVVNSKYCIFHKCEVCDNPRYLSSYCYDHKCESGLCGHKRLENSQVCGNSHTYLNPTYNHHGRPSIEGIFKTAEKDWLKSDVNVKIQNLMKEPLSHDLSEIHLMIIKRVIENDQRFRGTEDKRISQLTEDLIATRNFSNLKYEDLNTINYKLILDLFTREISKLSHEQLTNFTENDQKVLIDNLYSLKERPCKKCYHNEKLMMNTCADCNEVNERKLRVNKYNSHVIKMSTFDK